MSVATGIYCGGELDELATLNACRRLLTFMGAGLQELRLTVNRALEPSLHR